MYKNQVVMALIQLGPLKTEVTYRTRGYYSLYNVSKLLEKAEFSEISSQKSSLCSKTIKGQYRKD